jgi:hypothetical protein
MSITDDQTRAQNLQNKEDSKNAWNEHVKELTRQRLASEAMFDPRVVAYKARRKEQANQPRKIQISFAVRKPRQFATQTTTYTPVP